MKKTLLAATAIFFIVTIGNAKAEDSVNDRIAKLEQEIQLLKKELKKKSQSGQARQSPQSPQASKSSQAIIAPEAVSTQESVEKADLANVEIGKKGLRITSPDKKYQFDVHGNFQFDNRSFISNNNETTGRSETIARRVRPSISLKAGDALLVFTPDFAGNSTTTNNTKTVDAYAEYKFSNVTKLRVGKFKTPVGLEVLQSDGDTFFTEVGFAASLAPQRDLGAQISGLVFADILEYQLGIFNGVVDNSNGDGDVDDKKDIALRVFAKPFKNLSIASLQGFGIGVGGSLGEREGSAANRILPTYLSPGQRAFFTYASTAFASGTQYRISPQAYWYSGNKGLMGEYAISGQDVAIGTTKLELKHTAWNIGASYVLTGEDVNYSGTVKPSRQFNIAERNWGAWEVVARFGALFIDGDAFSTLASISTSAKSAQSYGAGINWYLNENIKIMTNYNYTEFSGGATSGRDKPEEQLIQSRLQFRF